MSDLMSREALIDFIEERSGSFGITVANKCNFKEIVKMMKPVDAVEVVYCSKCEYWGNKEFAEGGYRVCECPNKDYATTDPKNHVYFPLTLETDFCSYGERKEVSE